MNYPRRRVVTFERAPRVLNPPAPLGQGTRRIDRPIALNPAVERMPASDINKIVFALRMLDRTRDAFRAEPTHDLAAEYAALHWLLTECGVIVDASGGAQ